MHGNKRFYNGLKKRPSTMAGNNSYCVCEQCGYTIPHLQGVPCRQNICPKCNTPLTRGGQGQSLQNSSNVGYKNASATIPIINANLCVGCGKCAQVCNKNAISIINKKAVIDANKCVNCRLCVGQCKINAIS